MRFQERSDSGILEQPVLLAEIIGKGVPRRSGPASEWIGEAMMLRRFQVQDSTQGNRFTVPLRTIGLVNGRVGHPATLAQTGWQPELVQAGLCPRIGFLRLGFGKEITDDETEAQRTARSGHEYLRPRALGPTPLSAAIDSHLSLSPAIDFDLWK